MRLAVLADVHGNLPALEAVLADLDRRGWADAVVDLGDRVSGPLWPAETAALLGRLDPVGVRGNHDRRVGEAASADGLGRTDAFAWERLDPAARAALAALPAAAEPAPGVLAVHARPGRDDAYLIETVKAGRQVRAKPRTILRRLGPVEARLVLTAHSHRADLLRLPSGVTLLNPGSVGVPALWDDGSPAHAIEAGTPHARYALVDLGDGIAATFVAVPYDHEAAARQAEAAGRPDWAHGLRTGLALRPSRRA